MGAIISTVRSLVRMAVVLVSTSLAVQSAPASTCIVVNFKGYPSVDIAAHAENDVNWLDADHGAGTICTEAFAAVELQHYLREITGRKDDFAIAGDKQLARGRVDRGGFPDLQRHGGENGARPGRQPRFDRRLEIGRLSHQDRQRGWAAA